MSPKFMPSNSRASCSVLPIAAPCSRRTLFWRLATAAVGTRGKRVARGDGMWTM